MVIYEYRCDEDGAFDRRLPLGTAPGSLPCPACGNPASRVFSAPMYRSTYQRAWTRAMDRAEKSRHEPDVVHSPPPTGMPGRTIALTPQLRGLPRP
jgi:putative FmdB family regulatory protein